MRPWVTGKLPLPEGCHQYWRSHGQHLIASTGQAVYFTAPAPANEGSLKKSRSLVYLKLLHLQPEQHSGPVAQVKQCSWSDCPQNPHHHWTEVKFYSLCHWNLGLFLHLAQFSNLDKESQVPFPICKMGRAFFPCLHVAHWGGRVQKTLPEQLSQSPQCQQFPLGTMALPGSWTFLNAGTDILRIVTSLFSKWGTSESQGTGFVFLSKKHAFHWAHTSALT